MKKTTQIALFVAAITLGFILAKNISATTNISQVQPCVWPNTCGKTVVQFQPCVWPNRCFSTNS